jgi:hypothetical protein
MIDLLAIMAIPFLVLGLIELTIEWSHRRGTVRALRQAATPRDVRGST